MRKTVGDLVRARREALGITTREAASRSSISHSTWNQVETGRMNSTLDTMSSVAGALGAEWDVRLRPSDAPEMSVYARELVDQVLALADRLPERDARHLVLQLRIYAEDLRVQGKSTK